MCDVVVHNPRNSFCKVRSCTNMPNISVKNITRKLATAKMTARCALYMGAPILRVPEYARGYRSRNYWRAFVPVDHMNVRSCVQNLKFLALPASWDNSNWSSGWGCEPQSWGRGGHRGSGMVPFESALVSSYRPSIVTFPLSLRVRDAAFVLQHATFSHPHL